MNQFRSGFHKQQRNLFHKLILRIVAVRPVAWLLRQTLYPVDRWLFSRTEGKVSLTGLLTGTPIILLTTIGAKTGMPRSVPLLTVPVNNSFVVFGTYFGSNRYPAWYYNLKKNPLATISGEHFSNKYIAREATSEEHEIYWPKAVAMYGGYQKYKDRVKNRHIPIFILDPIED